MSKYSNIGTSSKAPLEVVNPLVAGTLNPPKPVISFGEEFGTSFRCKVSLPALFTSGRVMNQNDKQVLICGRPRMSLRAAWKVDFVM